MATIASELAERPQRPDMLSGTPRAHSIDRWIFVAMAAWFIVIVLTGFVPDALGKSARAEPVALKFETGKAFFAGEFAELEAELGGMVAGGGYEGPGRSPDRADAMVWAMTALGETRSGVPRVRRL